MRRQHITPRRPLFSVVRFNLIAGLGLLACGSAWSQPYRIPDEQPLTPQQRREAPQTVGQPNKQDKVATQDSTVPIGNTIGDFQTACYAKSSHTNFSQQVACIKGLISGSTNPSHSLSDPDVQLYVLTADKLVDDVQHKRITASAARVELQHTYMEIRQRHEAQRTALQQQQAAATQAAAEAQARAQEAEAQAQLERAQLQARAEAAVERCIDIANAKKAAMFQQMTQQNARNNQVGGIAQGVMVAGGNPVMQLFNNLTGKCRANPNWYETLPMPPTSVVTECEERGAGFTCTTPQ